MTLASIILSVLLSALPVIPYPQEVKQYDGSFDASISRIHVAGSIPQDTKEYIGEFASEYSMGKGPNVIRFVPDSSLGEEEYTMKVRRGRIVVKASTHRGFIYATQTLRQLLTDSTLIPCMDVRDYPRFSYRGVLLDCVRHFYTIEETKKIIDILSFHKLNVLHWHLSDDHAWRIEIKKYPELVRVGAFGDIGSRTPFDPNAPFHVEYEGYYTQDQIRDIVAYAAHRGITIIPEIDFPGHMAAAMAAYPWLGCTGGPYKVINVVGPRSKGLAGDSLCPGKESTFEFLENVFLEIMDLFPSEYIHIGGDECIKKRWKECPDCIALVERLGLQDREDADKWQQLEVWMANRISKFFAEHGRKIIGWDELLDGDLGKDVTITSWRGTKTGIRAAKKGYDVVMSPSRYAYFDKRQSVFKDLEPNAFSGTLPVDTVYFFNPTLGLDEQERTHIIGVQANVWCDVIASPQVVEYMLLPRLAAMSEVQWRNVDEENWRKQREERWPLFRCALDNIRKYYDAHGYIYAKHLWGVIGLPGFEKPVPTEENNSNNR